MSHLARLLALALSVLTALAPVAQAQQFPQTLPPNSVVGRLGVSAGPAQAIPFRNFANAFLGQLSLTLSYSTRAAAVAAIVPANTPVIMLNGYTTAGDGGQNALYGTITCPAVNAPDFQSADGQCWGLIAPVPNLMMFGADSTGVLSSTTPLTNWLSYVYRNEVCGVIPPGTFKFAGPLTVTASGGKGLCIIGAGPRQTRLVNTSLTGNHITLDTSASGMNGMRISGIAFDNSSAATSGYAIANTSSNAHGLDSSSLISDIQTNPNVAGGISIQSASNMTIDNVSVYNVAKGHSALKLVGTLNATINGLSVNNFRVVGGATGGATSADWTTGIYAGDYVLALQVNSCQIQAGAQPGLDYGIWIATTSTDYHVTDSLKFVDCYADAVSRNPLRVDGGFNVGFFGSSFQFAAAGFDGALINGVNGLVIEGGHIRGNLRRGINVLGGTGVKIHGNTLSENGTEGGGTGNYDDVAVADGVSNFSIADNTFVVSGSSAIARSNINIAGPTNTHFAVTGNVTGNSTIQPIVDGTACSAAIDKVVAWNTGTISPNGNCFPHPLLMPGATSGLVTVLPTDIAGTPTIRWPNTSGTVVTNATAPVAIDTSAGTVSITGLAGGVLAGPGPAFTRTPTLGASGTLGSLTFGNATSGTVTVQTVTGALGTPTLSLPAATDTLVGKATTDTLTNKTFDTAGTGNSFSINSLAATANTGTGAVVRAISPTFTGTPILPTPFTLGAVSVTSTGTQLNYLSSATGTTGTASTNVVFSGSPTIASPTITGAFTATGLVTNADLVNAATTVGGSTCTLGSTCGLTVVTNSISADVSLNNTGTFFDGPSVAQGTSGTWFASGTVVVYDGAGGANIRCKLWDGTTVIASTTITTSAINVAFPLSLSGKLATPAANIRISCLDATSTSGKIAANGSGIGNTDSTLTAFRIN